MASPDINNYYIGKGNVRFRPSDGPTAGVFRHVGNVPEFEWTPELEELEHKTSMEGVRSVDLTIVVEKKGSLRIVLEEWTPENLALALMHDAYSSGAIQIFKDEAIRGQVLFTNSNTVGPRYEWHFLAVDIIPDAAMGLITEEFGPIELKGKVSTSNGSFGTVTAHEVTA